MSRHSWVQGTSSSRDEMTLFENSVWVEHPTEGYTPGRIVREVGLADVEVEAPDGYKSVLRKDQCTPIHRNSLSGVPNLLDLGEFSMAALLHNVRVRYKKGDYYSSIGLPILISVNPYRPMPHLYDAPTRRRYQSAHFLLQSPPPQTRSPPARSPISSAPQTAASDESVADRKLFIDHPHLFGTAQMTYASLMRNNQAQSIVISGESGAGKTEATKILLRYFSELEETSIGSSTGLRRPPASPLPLAGSRNPSAGGGRTTSTTSAAGVQMLSSLPGSTLTPEHVSIELHTLRSNPILEAFGNAKTVRNDNSSRFGKFIQIFFDVKNPKRVRSARISHYLLEKCRLVSVYPPERNFHIFYALLFGARDDSRWFRRLENWGLDDPVAFYKILGDEADWECGSETEMFDELLSCLTSTGFTEDDIRDIFATIAGLLHLSTFEFESVDDPSHAYTAGAPLCRLANPDALMRTAEMLQIDNVPSGTQGSDPAEGLLDVLLFKSVRNAEGQGSWIRSGRDVGQAHHVRDSIIKEVYSRLFSWIVKRINRALCSKEESEAHVAKISGFRDIKKRGQALSKAVHRNSGVGLTALQRVSQQTTPPIGLLDIYGFEVFEGRNSFEQLCINYANEKLQQHFNHHVLALEQKTYKAEDIDWSEIRFTDNKEIIKALEEPPTGVFVILDDTRVSDKNRDQLFLQQLDRTGRKEVVSLPPLKKFKNNVFSVRHYAGDVEYDCVGFVDKNQDKLELQSTYFFSRASGSSLIRQLFPVDEFADMTHRRNSLRATVSLEFRNQLESLLSSLTSTIPTYVRCIKPNGNKLPNSFDSLDALRQLKYAGLLESIRIRKSGFGVRCSFSEFLNDYALLRNHDFHLWRRKKLNLSDKELKAICHRILSDVVSTGASLIEKSSSSTEKPRLAWQLGRTKVFMKEEVQFHLEKCRSAVRTVSATRVESFWRGRLVRREYRRKLHAIILIQSLYRAKMARQIVYEWRASLRIQKYWRLVRPTRRQFLKLREAALFLQRSIRLWLWRRRIVNEARHAYLQREGREDPSPPYESDTPQDATTTQESLELHTAAIPKLTSAVSKKQMPTPTHNEPVAAPANQQSEDRTSFTARTSTGSHSIFKVRERRRRKHTPPSTRRTPNESTPGNEFLTALNDSHVKLRKAERLKDGYKREASNLKRQLLKRDDAIAEARKEIENLTEEIERRDVDMLQLLRERDMAEAVNQRLVHQVTSLRNSTDVLERIFSDLLEFVEDRASGMGCDLVQDCLIFMRSICSRSRHALARLDHRLRLVVSDEVSYQMPLGLPSAMGDFGDAESNALPPYASQVSCGIRRTAVGCDHLMSGGAPGGGYLPSSRGGSLRGSVPFEMLGSDRGLLTSRGSPIVDYMTMDLEGTCMGGSNAVCRSAPRHHHTASMSYDTQDAYLPAMPSQQRRRDKGVDYAPDLNSSVTSIRGSVHQFPSWRGVESIRRGDDTARSYGAPHHERVCSLNADSGPTTYRGHSWLPNPNKPPRAGHQQTPSYHTSSGYPRSEVWATESRGRSQGGDSLKCRPSASADRRERESVGRQSSTAFYPSPTARQPLDPYLQMGGKPLVNQRVLQKGGIHGSVRTSSKRVSSSEEVTSTSEECPTTQGRRARTRRD